MNNNIIQAVELKNQLTEEKIALMKRLAEVRTAIKEQNEIIKSEKEELKTEIKEQNKIIKAHKATYVKCQKNREEYNETLFKLSNELIDMKNGIRKTQKNKEELPQIKDVSQMLEKLTENKKRRLATRKEKLIKKLTIAKNNCIKRDAEEQKKLTIQKLIEPVTVKEEPKKREPLPIVFSLNNGLEQTATIDEILDQEKLKQTIQKLSDKNDQYEKEQPIEEQSTKSVSQNAVVVADDEKILQLQPIQRFASTNSNKSFTTEKISVKNSALGQFLKKNETPKKPKPYYMTTLELIDNLSSFSSCSDSDEDCF